jgi:histidine triad (HIT) family protein
MTNDCVFCKIVEGKLPSRKVYENRHILAFLTIEPISRGHLLIIPKKHFENIYDISESDLKEIIVSAKKIAKFLKTSLGATGINILHASGKDAQQSVFHFHIHIVPRYEGDSLDTWPKTNYKEKDFDKLLDNIQMIK